MNISNEKNNSGQSSKKILFLRFLGFILLAIGVILIVLGFVFKDTFAGMATPKMAFLVPGFFLMPLSIFVISFSFSNKTYKNSLKILTDFHEENKDLFLDLAKQSSEINSGMSTITAQSSQKKETNCQGCGAPIDPSSTVCPYCGRRYF